MVEFGYLKDVEEGVVVDAEKMGVIGKFFLVIGKRAGTGNLFIVFQKHMRDFPLCNDVRNFIHAHGADHLIDFEYSE